MVSLKVLAKKRVLEQMIIRVRQCVAIASSKTLDESYCTLVVDKVTSNILSSCCKMYDLISNGVADELPIVIYQQFRLCFVAVEDINKKRQPLPDFNVIYFLTPTMNSIELLCQDFSAGKVNQYGTVHVYFCLPLNNSKPLYSKISNCPELISRLRSFVEFNFGYITFERRVFHSNPGITLRDLFLKQKTECLQQITDELYTYCIGIGDRPNIRFHSNYLNLNERVATMLHQKLKASKITGITQGRTELIIVDRSIDLPPLFVHEYTYQAYVYDMLKIPVASTEEQLAERRSESNDSLCSDNVITYDAKGGAENKKTALLGEQDHVYVQYRHQHLMVALKKTSEDLKTFVKENAAAKLKNKQDLTNEDLRKVIRDLPAYQEMLAKYTLHNTITQECFVEFSRRMLNKVGAIEQDLATGIDQSGKEISVKKCLAALGSLLPDPSVRSEDKARLLLLYFSMIDGVKEIDSRKMIDAAQLPLETSQSIREFMTLNLTSGTEDPTLNNHVHRFHNKKDRLDYFTERTKTVEISLSRFEPYIKTIMQNAVQKTLHNGQFPYVADPSSQFKKNSIKASSNAGTKIKNWNFENDVKSTSSQSQLNEDLSSSQGKSITIFVIGGITFSETRCAYEVSFLPCILSSGGTTIITPPILLDQLKNSIKKPV